MAYVWARAIGSASSVSPTFDTPEQAGAWLRSPEGRAVDRQMLFGPTLMAIEDGVKRHARPEEWRRSRA